jgi:hypothetical protein
LRIWHIAGSATDDALARQAATEFKNSYEKMRVKAGHSDAAAAVQERVFGEELFEQVGSAGLNPPSS